MALHFGQVHAAVFTHVNEHYDVPLNYGNPFTLSEEELNDDQHQLVDICLPLFTKDKQRSTHLEHYHLKIVIEVWNKDKNDLYIGPKMASELGKLFYPEVVMISDYDVSDGELIGAIRSFEPKIVNHTEDNRLIPWQHFSVVIEARVEEM